jgi:ribosomal protein S1
MSTTALNRLIEDFNELPMDDKEYAVDVIRKQLTEAKRNAIAKRAREAMANFKKGTIRKGTVQDLYKDLEID